MLLKIQNFSFLRIGLPALFLVFVVGIASCAKPQGNVEKAAEASSKGWVSSGGERFEDALNPWWLRNVTTVDYCVQVDKETISISEARVKYIVAEAIRYWKLEFNGSPRLFDAEKFKHLKFNKIGVATQEFREVPCHANIDLQVQLGYGTLTPSQKEFLGEIQKYVGVAVRTHYDEEQLRGRGFVYIHSDRGDKSIRNARIPEIWRREGLLQIALLHEMGHVFGVPHDGAISYPMGQRFPEAMVHYVDPESREYRVAKRAEERPSYFFHERQGAAVVRNSVMLNNGPDHEAVMREFLGVPTDLKFFHDMNLGWPAGDLPEVDLSTVVFTEPRRTHRLGKLTDFVLEKNMRFSVLVFLNPKQRVFTSMIDGDLSTEHVFGPYRIGLNGTAKYISADGKTIRDVAVNFGFPGESGVEIRSTDKKFERIFYSRIRVDD